MTHLVPEAGDPSLPSQSTDTAGVGYNCLQTPRHGPLKVKPINGAWLQSSWCAQTVVYHCLEKMYGLGRRNEANAGGGNAAGIARTNCQ